MKGSFNRIVRIGNTRVGNNNKVFVVAEIGVNHLGKVELARYLIDMASVAGANAVKFQIYRTENLISRVAKDWIERMKAKELPYDAFRELKSYAEQKGLVFLATAHDEESFSFLQSLNPPAYKIGSGEVFNLPYIEKIASTGRPLILSTGMYTMEQIRKTVKVIASTGNKDLIILHCITRYPPEPGEVNLRVIETLKREFSCPVGYSDHSVGYDLVLASVAIGAEMVEKHFTVSKNIPGSQDCPVSCEPRELIEMINSIRRIEMALGTGIKAPSKREAESALWARKSIVAKRSIKKGEKITQEMITFKRPGTGIPPDRAEEIIGKKARKTIDKDEMLKLEDLEE